jgi:hypothetical protein
MNMADGRIEDRLSWVEARLELIELESLYPHRWDSGDAGGWAALFTEDGVFERIEDDDGNGEAVRGRGALAQLCADSTTQQASLHFLHLPDLRVSGARATGWMNFQFFAVGLVGGQMSQTMGFHEVTYVNKEGGWLIEQRREHCLYRQAQGVYASQFYAAVLESRSSP